MKRKNIPQDEHNPFNPFRLGVFELRVCGTVCAYFVGWRSRWYERGRNIRAGLYFPTAEAAIKFRDSIEDARQVFVDEHRQIG